jgi:chromosome segregation ATPase
MDIESFQSLKLKSLDFSEERSAPRPRPQSVENIPLPDEIPAGFNYASLPKEILKSSSVENLISQNEDLMTRLTVSLRRLAMLENENQRLNDDAQRARLSQSAVTDQILIFKEKDNLWKNKLVQAEKDKEIHVEKSVAYHARMLKLEAEVERFRKYHDRIKTQVKPYIHQLKEYSRSLEDKTQRQTQESAKLEAQLSDLRYQILEVTKNSRLQVEVRERQAQEMVQFYEQQIQSQADEVKSLNELNKELEIKALRLNKSLEKQDELENQVVELMRSKEELKSRLEQDVVRLQDKSSELHRQNKRLEIEHADLQELAVSHEAQLKTLGKDKQDLNEQLDSLRYMWNAKVEEAEKLKAAIQSLERLNVDLSQKVNELRSAQNP